MTVDMQKYTELLQDFSAISQAYINQETLDKLKARYKETINSKRVLENIVNIDSLLKVLEKRGVLQYNEISVLHQIAEIVQNSSIDDLIVNYEHWSTENFTTEINDLYSCAIVPGVEQQTNASSNKFEPKMPLFRPNVNLEYSANHSSVYSSTTPVSHADREKEIQSLVVNRISRKIGRYWADVSRRLNIEEAYIEDIENRYIEETHSHEKMFKEALKIYFSEKNSNWKRDLMTALESSKRKDLKEEVEKMVY
ncbi:fas-associated death domain protein isoform X2 [Nasonia vitripennis]|uniref:Death domain-containing protein n=1 Tax=Nasonia vitripennis TaxID=7425 RepID=A0A7M7Q3U1_NASVI|nr:fas-associated death domain protein isoform X2 [Nasonia vitripennis]